MRVNSRMRPGLFMASFTPADLDQFTGTTRYYRYWTQRLIYTDGVHYFAEQAGAYWFLDIVATEIIALPEPFMVVKLLSENDSGVITVDDGNGKIVYHRDIEWTDFPEGEWKFYLTDGVLMVPSEY